MLEYKIIYEYEELKNLLNENEYLIGINKNYGFILQNKKTNKRFYLKTIQEIKDFIKSI